MKHYIVTIEYRKPNDSELSEWCVENLRQLGEVLSSGGATTKIKGISIEEITSCPHLDGCAENTV